MNKVKNIGVIGSGTMGNGIAHVFSLSKFKVTLIDLDQSILNQAIETISQNMERQVKKGFISEQEMSNALNNISINTDINSLSDCELVIEAVSESYDIKSKIFNNLDSICKQDTILASNTSSISISEIAKSTNRSDKVIGMHFMNPVPIMKLIEVIKGDETSSDTLNIILDVSKKLRYFKVSSSWGAGVAAVVARRAPGREQRLALPLAPF